MITRDEFLDTLWGEAVYVTPRVVDTHVAALRKKLEDDPNHPMRMGPTGYLRAFDKTNGDLVWEQTIAK